MTSIPRTAHAPRTPTVSSVRHEPPISSAAAASGRNAERIPRPSQYIGNTWAMTCTHPHSAWIGKKMPEMAASAATGSIPQVLTFCVLGTSDPMRIPIGIAARSPRTRTHTTVSQPARRHRSSGRRTAGTRAAG